MSKRTIIFFAVYVLLLVTFVLVLDPFHPTIFTAVAWLFALPIGIVFGVFLARNSNLRLAVVFIIVLLAVLGFGWVYRQTDLTLTDGELMTRAYDAYVKNYNLNPSYPIPEFFISAEPIVSAAYMTSIWPAALSVTSLVVGFVTVSLRRRLLPRR